MVVHVDGHGQVIKKWREERGLSQQSLAAELGMSAAAVTQWERGVIVPKRTTAGKLDEVLGAGGEILAAFGYAVPVDPNVRISRLEEQVAELQALVERMSAQLIDLAERSLLPDVDDEPHPAESRTAR
jgi:transcriptional regulator with XRE-family HTH domain